ncbi:MAG: NifB/NifX family molybdenum-iron cluster-binding protein [Promethearchaeota archaeon]
MVERVVVPVLDEAGEASQLSPHFGRAPFFAIIHFSEARDINKIEFAPNRSEHFGGQGRPPDILLSFRPNTVITFGMGPRALRRFQAEGVAVMQANSQNLGEVLRAYKNEQLMELTEGCRDARHK